MIWQSSIKMCDVVLVVECYEVMLVWYVQYRYDLLALKVSNKNNVVVIVVVIV